MNFFQNLVQRHVQPAGNIKPRLPQRFEAEGLHDSGFSPKSMDDHGDLQQPENRPSVHHTPDSHEKSTTAAELRPNTVSRVSHQVEEKEVDLKEQKSTSVKRTKPTLDFPAKKMKEENHLQETKKKSAPVKEDTIVRPHKIDNPSKIQSEPQHTPTQAAKAEKKSKNDPSTDLLSVKPRLTTKSAEPGELVEPFGKKSNQQQEPLALPDWFNTWMDKPTKESGRQEKPQESAGSIRINIGRIEVKAIHEASPAPQPRKTAFKPQLTLEDFLKQRNGSNK